MEPKRAMEALDWAVVCADKGVWSPPVKGSAEDFRVASELYGGDVRKQLDRILMSRNAEIGLDALLESGALGAILPEVEAMVGFGDGEWRHKDVWKHTKQVVWQAVPRIEVRWAALLHDIGKVKTRKIEPSGEVHFFGHSEVGAAMFRKRVGKRLGFTGELYERVHYLILYH